MNAADEMIKSEPSPFSGSINRIRGMRGSSRWPALVPEVAANERAFRVATAREAVRPKLCCRTTEADVEDQTVSWCRELLRPFVWPSIVVASFALSAYASWKLLEVKSVYDFVLRVFPP